MDQTDRPTSSAQNRQTPGEDGYPLTYRVWTRPDARTTLVLLNGVMSHASWFDPLVAPLMRSPLHIVGADRRGSGLNVRERGDAPSAGILVHDVARIIDAEHDASRALVVVGWCWGAVLATHVTFHLGDAVDRLVFIAPGLFPSGEVRARAAIIAREPNGDLESPVSEEMFTTGPHLEGFILRDERRLRRITRRFFDLMSRMSIAAAARLPRLSPPILVVLADRDRATDNDRTIAAFRTAKRVTFETLHAGHGIQFDAPGEAAERILSWIEGR